MGRAVFGWVIAAVVVCVPAVYFAVFQEDVIEVTAKIVERGNVEQTISAISAGTVKPKQESMVASGLLGKVALIVVNEGDRVQTGDVLLELDHRDLDAQVLLAKANLEAGKSRLQQVQMGAKIGGELARTRVSQANAQLDLAQTDFNRLKALADRKAISQSEFDKASLALRVAQEGHAAALASQQEDGVREEEIASAQSVIEQLEAAVQVAEETREKAIVRAPFDGVVAKIHVKVGEAIALGMPLLKMVDDSEYYVKAPFDEANAALIQVGQIARINVDAYRGTDFPGKVEFISPIVSQNLDLSRTLDIDVLIEDGQDKFVAGMSADVILVAEKKQNVLYVPSEALIREQKAFIIEDGRIVEREVKVGIGNMLTKEVLSGLEEGELLVTSVTVKGLKTGARVTVVDELKD